MSVVRAFAGAVSAVLLTACITVAPDPRPVPAPFDVVGRVLISGEGRAFSSSLRWLHETTEDELWLMSPVGQTLAHIVADATGAILTTPDLQEYRAISVDSLTRRALGWSLPLSGLRYWIQSMPAPGANVTVSNRDSAGRLSLLEQDGWSIRYSYPDAPSAVLPRRLDLTRNGQQIRLVIDSWRGEDKP